MTTEPPRQPPRDYSQLCVCFSGGGFRASFYCLGILRYLAEAGHLPHLSCISAVSGGSIAAAAIGDRWDAFLKAGATSEAFLREVDKPFRDAVTHKSIRRRWIFASIAALVPFSGGRGGALARVLAHNLYGHKRLSELPERPEFIFTSTDLSKGHAFRAAPRYLGSWDYGYITTPTSVHLGTAVAASAAFPPSLAIVELRTRGMQFPKDSPPRRLSLVDGGVYDNLGLEWIQGWKPDSLRPPGAVKPTFTIVANASGILEPNDRRYHPWSALGREFAIQYQQTLSLRARWQYDTAASIPYVYMAIKDDPRTDKRLVPKVISGALPGELVRPLALLRTDLDRFTREEADLLSYHAYWTLHARLSSEAPELALADPEWTEFANLPAARVGELRATLELGSHRFFRRLRRPLRS